MAYATLASLKSYIDGSSTDAGGSTDDDALLTSLITYAQAVIEEATGRVFEGTTDTVATHYFEWPRDVQMNTLFADGDFLGTSDIVVVNGTDTLSSSDYVFEPPQGPPYWGIRLKSSSSEAWGNADSDGNYENAISITDKWAYSVSVPSDIAYACMRLARWFYRQRNDDTAITTPIVTASGATLMPASMPEDVKAILKRYTRTTFA